MNRLVVGDYIVIGAYVIGVLLLGILFAGRQKSMKEYFLASGNMPWWAVSLSMYATLLSPITFLGAAGWIYQEDSRYFFSTAVLALVTFPLAAYVWVPIWDRLRTVTIYEYLERRFHPGLRTFGAILFPIQMIFWVGNGLVAAAMAFSSVSGIPMMCCLLGIVLLGTAYTILGGSRAVIWTDVVQSVIFLFAFITIGLLLLKYFNWSPGEIHAIASAEESAAGYAKTQLFSAEFSLSVEATIWALLLAKIVEIFTFGSDQRTMQRLMSTGTRQHMFKAVVGLAGVQFIFWMLAIFVAWGFVAYYKVNPEAAKLIMQPDEVMARYVVGHLPILVRGLIIAGLLAAMMSTFDSALNSMSSSAISDFYKRYFVPNASDTHYVKCSRYATLGWGLLVLVFAVWQSGHTDTTVLKRVGQFNVLLLPMIAIFFILGVFTRRCNAGGALVGALTSFLLVMCFQGIPELMDPLINYSINWIWLEGLCTVTGCVTGYIASLLFAAPAEEQLKGLTIYEKSTPRPDTA